MRRVEEYCQYCFRPLTPLPPEPSNSPMNLKPYTHHPECWHIKGIPDHLWWDMLVAEEGNYQWPFDKKGNMVKNGPKYTVQLDIMPRWRWPPNRLVEQALES
jgi:hypothetical protein